MRHWPHLKMESEKLTPELLQEQDCVLISTDHTAYDWNWIAEHSRLLIDTRNATKGLKNRERIVRA
jgi:UDP-N-acetyl-D-glucosamine dehydrogenase